MSKRKLLSEEWKATSLSLHGITCLRHAVTRELTAWGRLGCLFEAAEGELAVIRYEPNGDETMVRGIQPSDAKRWVKRLQIPGSASAQAALIGPQNIGENSSHKAINI